MKKLKLKYRQGGETESSSQTKPGFYTEQGGDRSGIRYYLNERGEKIYDSMPDYGGAKGYEVKPGVDYMAKLDLMKSKQQTANVKPKLKTPVIASKESVKDQGYVLAGEQLQSQQVDINRPVTSNNLSGRSVEEVNRYYKGLAPGEIEKTARETIEPLMNVGKLGSLYPPVALGTIAASLGVTVADITENPEKWKDSLKEFGIDAAEIAASYGVGQGLKYAGKGIKAGIKAGVAKAKPFLRSIAEKLTPKHKVVDYKAKVKNSMEDVNDSFNEIIKSKSKPKLKKV
jgi:hypothetical protein